MIWGLWLQITSQQAVWQPRWKAIGLHRSSWPLLTAKLAKITTINWAESATCWSHQRKIQTSGAKYSRTISGSMSKQIWHPQPCESRTLSICSDRRGGTSQLGGRNRWLLSGFMCFWTRYTGLMTFSGKSRMIWSMSSLAYRISFAWKARNFQERQTRKRKTNMATNRLMRSRKGWMTWLTRQKSLTRSRAETHSSSEPVCPILDLVPCKVPMEAVSNKRTIDLSTRKAKTSNSVKMNLK